MKFLRGIQEKLTKAKNRIHSPHAFGLDISDDMLKLIDLQKRAGPHSQIEVRAFSSLALPRNVIKKGIIADAGQFAKHLEELISQAKPEAVGVKKVIVNLPERRVYVDVINFKVPKQGEALKKAVHEEARKKVLLEPDKLIDDFIVVEPHEGHEGEGQDVIYVAVDREAVEAYLKSFQAAGFKVIAFDVESASLARALVSPEEQETTIMLIDIGAETTIITIFDRHEVRFSSNVNVAGTSFTKKIAHELELEESEAEKMKKQYGMKGGDELNSRLLRVLVSELEPVVKNIQQAIYFYSQTTGRTIQKIRLSGGTANMPGLQQYLQEALAVKVELGDWIGLHKVLLRSGFESEIRKQSLGYATAFGMALRGTEKEAESQGINLLPSFQRSY